MNSVISILVFGTAITAIAANLNCPRGSVYQDGCQQCKCSERTGLVICNDEACKSSGPSVVSSYGGISPNCPRGTFFQQDECNDCTCNPATGLTKCTSNDCISYDKNSYGSHGSHGSHSSDACPKGLNYKIGCNTCTCNLGLGTYSCTNDICPSHYSGFGSIGNSNICPRGQFYHVDCNTCTCNESSNTYTCTRKNCYETQKCKPYVDRYTKGCNTCTCNTFGTDYDCTQYTCNSRFWSTFLRSFALGR